MYRAMFMLTVLFAALGPAIAPTRADVFTIAVGSYDSPNFTNRTGTYNFTLFGSTTSPSFSPITLIPNVVQTLALDGHVQARFDFFPRNGDATTLFSGTSSSTLTIEGISQTVIDAYTLDVGDFPGAITPTFSGGPTLTFDLGTQGVVTVTPIPFRTAREADFLFTPATPVPEPTTLTLLVFGGATLVCFSRLEWRRAR